MIRHHGHILLLAGALALAAQARATELGPGIEMDAGQQIAFVAGPDGNARAIDLTSGEARWSSSEVAWPLGVVQGRLLALGAAPLPGLGILLVLDADSGAVQDRIAFDLPEAVHPDLFPKPARRFEARLVDHSGMPRLHWRYFATPLRGAIPSNPEGEPVFESTELEGAVDFALGATRSHALPVQSDVAWPALAAVDLDPAERLPGLPATQYRSADNGFVLVSQVGPKLEDAFQWSIHARSGRRLGSLESAYALAPFTVSGTTLYFRSEAEGRRDPQGRWQELPARLVAYDLSQGLELWSVPVLDREFRGVLPP